MGSGKTTIAQNLALKTSIPFFDLDTLIEKKEQKTVDEIFKTKGELYFRKQEHILLKNFIENTPEYILSLGGGTPCYATNDTVFEEPNVVSIYLKATPKTLANRLKFEIKKRPLLQQIKEEEVEEFIAKHLFERNQFYRKATYTLAVDAKNIDEIVEEIEKYL